MSFIYKLIGHLCARSRIAIGDDLEQLHPAGRQEEQHSNQELDAILSSTSELDCSVIAHAGVTLAGSLSFIGCTFCSVPFDTLSVNFGHKL